MNSSPVESVGGSKRPDATAEATTKWVAELASAEQSVKIVHSQLAVPLVDWTPALEQPTKQLLIVGSPEHAQALTAIVRGIAVLSWGAAGTSVDLATLLRRDGRKVFIWLHNERTREWLCERLDALGYQVTVLPPAGEEVMTDWDTLKAWVMASKTPWERIPAPEEVDILPAKAPPDPVAEPQTPKTSKPKGAKRQAIVEAQTELERIAVDKRIALEGSMHIDDWMRLGLHITSGKPTGNVSNVALLFDSIKPGAIWYDEFLQAIMTRGGDGKTRRWTDADDIRTTIEVQRRCGVPGAHKTIVSDAVIEFAMRNVRNCLKEYVMGLVWDMVPRLAHVLEDLFGVEESQYHTDVGINWFKSMIARAMWPGCKVDTMPVFEGSQGIGKSTVIEYLGGEWYAIMKESPDNKDFYLVMAGKWIIEIAELDAFSRSDIKGTKRALSTAIDRFRPPYGKHAEDHNRQCVFAGTVNGNDWNKDPTGARRFWPVACLDARPDIAKLNRDQYFAEALHLLMHDDTERPEWWTFKAPDEVKRQQDSRYVEDDWAILIDNLLRGRSQVSPAQIYQTLMLEENEWGKSAQMRVSTIMKRRMWQNKDVWIKEDNRTRRMWVRMVAES